MDMEEAWDWDDLDFSFRPTDSMAMATVDEGGTWGPCELQPFGPLQMHPSAGVLNYGQGLFEGMKAYNTDRGRVVMFRPELNARRMQAGADRLGMPPVPEAIFIDAIEQVVDANRRHIPPMGRGALYVRPLLFGSGAVLGVKPAPSFTFMVFCTPVGPYFKGGLSAIDLLISEDHHRAAPGGSGGVKAIGNYAPGMVPSRNAKAQGFAEIIYLDAVHHTYIEEVGAANFFCVKDGVLHTPELSGTILPGITRLSILELASDLGYEVQEGKVPADLAMESEEAFCCGTAAVISPIGSIQRGDLRRTYGTDSSTIGPVTRRLYDELTGIQEERIPDRLGWIHPVPELG